MIFLAPITLLAEHCALLLGFTVTAVATSQQEETRNRMASSEETVKVSSPPGDQETVHSDSCLWPLNQIHNPSGSPEQYSCRP